jgi:hypothetical protein
MPSCCSRSRMRRAKASACAPSPCRQTVCALTAHDAAVDGRHAVLAHERQRLRDGLLFVLDQRARLAARHQAAVGHVAAVGEHLFHRREAGAAGRIDHVAAGQAEELQRGVEAAHRLAQRLGELGLLHGLVVELAVRLHVRQLAALGLHDRRQRADLIEHVGHDLVGRQVHGAAPEVLAVRKARVRADGHAVAQRPAHALLHGLGIARVPAAGDVGGAHQREQGFVAAGAFAEVCIEVDLHGDFL